MNTALATQTKTDITEFTSFGSTPNLDEVERIAKLMIASGAFADIKSTAAAMVKIMAGYEIGIQPLAAMNGIHFIPTQSGVKVVPGAEIWTAKIQASGRYDFTITELNDERCVLECFKLRGTEWLSCGVPVVYTFENAKQEGLTGKTNWKYKQDMLFASAIRKAKRRYFADLILSDALAGEFKELPEATAHELGITADSQEFDEVAAAEIHDAEIISEEENAELTAIAELDELRESVRQAIEAHTFGDAAEIKKILKGRQIEMETAENLRKLLSEIENG
jgi:hypothetical protein